MTKEELQFYFFNRNNRIYFCHRMSNDKVTYREWTEKIDKVNEFYKSDFENLLKTLKIFSSTKMCFDDLIVEEFIGEKYKLIIIESKRLKDFFNSYYMFKANSIYEKLIGNKLYIIHQKKDFVI